MPIIEEQDAYGEIRRKFIVRTTTERRRDKRVRAALRKWKIGIVPEVYARVWAATAGVSDPEAVALVYQAELARAALTQAYGHRPEALALATKQISRAAKALAPASAPPLLALPPIACELAEPTAPRGSFSIPARPAGYFPGLQSHHTAQVSSSSAYRFSLAVATLLSDER